jgi:hypothetical protein
VVGGRQGAKAAAAERQGQRIGTQKGRVRVEDWDHLLESGGCANAIPDGRRAAGGARKVGGAARTTKARRKAAAGNRR